MHKTQLLILAVFAVFAIALIGCGEDQKIEQTCEGFCDQEIQCWDEPESERSACIDECIGDVEEVREDVDGDCFSALLDAAHCESELSCSQLDSSSSCDADFVEAMSVCGDDW